MNLSQLFARLAGQSKHNEQSGSANSARLLRYTRKDLHHRIEHLERLLPRLFRFSELRRSITELEERVSELEKNGPSDSLLSIPGQESFVYAEFVKASTGPDAIPYWIAIDKHGDDPVVSFVRDGDDWAGIFLGSILRLVKPGMTVLDLGSHIGTFSLACAARGARVISVEPSARSCALLNASAAVNGFHNVRVENISVGRSIGSAQFLDLGSEGMILPDDSDQPGGTSVKMTTVDALLSARGLQPPDIIKIDVEGLEWDVLSGMEQTLKTGDPIVVFEGNGYKLDVNGRRIDDIFELMRMHGFQLFELVEDGLTPVTPSHFQIFNVSDYLAVRELPEALSEETRFPCPSTEEQAVSIFNWSSNNPNVAERRHLAMALRHAAADLLNNPFTQKTLENLRNDKDPEVREKSAWSENSTTIQQPS